MSTSIGGEQEVMMVPYVNIKTYVSSSFLGDHKNLNRQWSVVGTF